MRKQSFCWMAIAVLLCSCGGKTTRQEVEDEIISPRMIDLSEVRYSDTPQLLSAFVDSIEYIRISDTLLIPDLRKVHLAEDAKGNVYLDFDKIYKYTADGRFVQSLFKIGEGPGEVNAKYEPGIYNMCEHTVWVQKYGEQYSKYTLDGEFVGSMNRKTGITNFNLLACWNNGELFRYESDMNPQKGDVVNLDSAYFFKVRDKNGKIVYQLPNYHFDIKATSPGHGTILTLGGPIDYGEISKSLFWVKPIHVDTVYCTTDWTDVRPYYIIRKNDKAADYKWYVRMQVGDLTREDAGKEQLTSVCAFQSGMLFGYLFDRQQFGVGFCQANGKAGAVSKVFKNDVDGYCPSLDMWQAMGYKILYPRNGYLYLLVDAFKFFEEGAKSPFADLTEDSNPVLVKLKLK